MQEICDVAIVGMGASGALAATQIAIQVNKEIKVIGFDDAEVARGVAYGTPHMEHLLNVPAGKISVLPDQPQHLLAWLQQNHPDLAGDPGRFIPRKIFGNYVEAVLREALDQNPQVTFETKASKVTEIERQADGYMMTASDGQVFKSRHVILALGNLAPKWPGAIEDTPVSVGNPWGYDWLSKVEATQGVFILGTGLTMVDMVVSLIEKGFEGPIYALSRRGLLPMVHNLNERKLEQAFDLRKESGLSQRLKTFRSALREHQEQGGSVRAVIDSLRGATPELWQSLSLVEKRRFLRHLRPYWDVARHRVASEIHEGLQAAITRGQLKVLRGRLHTILSHGEAGATVSYKPHRQEKLEELQVSVALNCTGPANLRAAGHLLLEKLAAKGMIVADELGMGLQTDAQGRLKGSGNAQQNLWTLGSMKKGQEWESIAIPEIRVQAQKLATAILNAN